MKNIHNLSLDIPKARAAGVANRPMITMADNPGRLSAVVAEDVFMRNHSEPHAGQDQFVEALLAGANQAEITERLLDVKQRVDINGLDKQGRTPLMAVADAGAHMPRVPDVIDFLGFLGAEVDRQNHRGETALMKAAGSNNLLVLRLLLHHGANAHKETTEGKRAIDFARENGHLEAVGILEGALSTNP